MGSSLNDVTLTPLRRIETLGGDVMHGLKNSDAGFHGFGEAYFSCIEPGYVKGWKRHRVMTLNLVVPIGLVRIGVHCEVARTQAFYTLGPASEETYCRLTVPPGLWVAFGGADKVQSVMLNVASIPHDPQESDTVPLSAVPWQWS